MESVSKIILHHGKEHTILVDLEDAHLLDAFTWWISFNRKNGVLYACASVRADGKRQYFRLHRLVMNAQPGQLVDHRNGNGLDCRKENLRLASNQQNVCNSRRRSTSTTPFRGVSLVRPGIWSARIRHNGKQHHLGYFRDPVVAAHVYDDHCARLRGEFARLNFEKGVSE